VRSKNEPNCSTKLVSAFFILSDLLLTPIKPHVTLTQDKGLVPTETPQNSAAIEHYIVS